MKRLEKRLGIGRRQTGTIVFNHQIHENHPTRPPRVIVLVGGVYLAAFVEQIDQDALDQNRIDINE